ncbi:Uu.00g048510.m01.CDS01 [Anthostomella pinea]|uniref:Uu.00g048510.m01.CDS01 n=1 Tax=Anthostomella pinea TaxID=933095 RepID=A0AAI8V6Q0_9PEZI|nr:Uu.00g048510.m01.CDS01 [Anthostomella pinea]
MAHRTPTPPSATGHMEKRVYDGVVAYRQYVTDISPDTELKSGGSHINGQRNRETVRRAGPAPVERASMWHRTGLQRPNPHDALTFPKSGTLTTLTTLTTLLYMQNAEQVVSTIMWAVMNRDLEGKGDKYLERCKISEPAPEGPKGIEPGYIPWAYNESDAKRPYAFTPEARGLRTRRAEQVSCELHGFTVPTTL